MNATLTNLSDVLRRWRRGITRAVLLAGALAGMTLGTVAHAQIVARTPAQSASQAAPPAPTFKSFSAIAAAATGGADPTVTLPAHAANDILLLATIVRSNTATVATPAGWTQIGTPTVRSTVATYQFFWKRAASGAETNPLINRTGTTGDVYAAVIVYQGAITTGDPWEVKGTAQTGTTDPSVFTGITTLTANSLVVVAVAGENDNNASIITTGTNPAAYTEHYVESTTGANGVITFSEFVRTPAGATGNVSVNWNTAVPVGFGGIVLALRPPISTITIALPLGTVANDVMVASISFRLNSPGVDSRDIAITPPAGWALVGPTGRMDNLNSTSSGLAVYSKVSAGEAGPYTWTFSCINVSGGNTCVTLGFNAAAGGIVSFSGVDTTTPIDVESGAPTAAATTTPATPSPGPTTTVGNTMLVTSHAIPNANTWVASPPSGMLQAFQRASGALMIQVSTALQAAAGATGPKSATDLGPDAADYANAHILALRPALVLNQSAYRLFNNADSTDVGSALAALNTAATLTTTGAAFRLRMLLHVAGVNLGISGQAFKLQFAVRSGTCDTSFSGETYADVTAATVIAYNNNATPTDGATLTNNANDPTHSGHTLRNQTYEELNNFTNSALAINAGEDGKWDFSLKDNGAPAGTTYCFRVVRSTGTVLETYTVIPEITTATPPVAGGFNAYETSTALGAITGVIMTKRAGSPINLDMIALNVAKTAIETTFAGTVRVEVLNAADNSGALDGNGCRPSWTVIQTLSPDPVFTDGRDPISFTQANSYPNVRLRITFPAGAPTITGCSNDNFAIRPDTFASFAVSDTTWETTGTPGARALNLLTFAATTPIHKAGRPFSVRATAVNTAAATTGNYTGAPTATLSTCVGAACTATFGTLTLTTTFVAGQLASDVASYNNVGSFALRLEDQNFASVDSGDGTPADCSATGQYVCSATINVGRFVPDHLAVSLNGPVFGTDCGSFTYVGKAFAYTIPPVITVTGQDFSNNPTSLYTGAWFRVSNSSLTGRSYTAAPATLNTGGLPLPSTDPTINSALRTLTFSSGTGLLFDRTTPGAPFDAEISLAINVSDDDTVAYASNPARFGQTTAGNGIAFSSGKPMRFGRLAIRNANGSQLVPLPVQVEAQYWGYTNPPTNTVLGFITNTADSCTSIASANDAMGNYTSNLSGSPTCETAISGGGLLSAGRKTLQLAAPGSGNNGSVDLTVNLGALPAGNTCTTLLGAPVSATTAILPHLQGNWTGGAYNVNPSARATFGVYKGAEEIIFVRENF